MVLPWLLLVLAACVLFIRWTFLLAAFVFGLLRNLIVFVVAQAVQRQRDRRRKEAT